MRRIKVLHVIRPLGHRGTERNAQILATRVNRGIFEPSVLGTSEGGERAELIAKDGVEVVLAKGDCKFIERYIAHVQPDILHLHSNMPTCDIHAVVAGLKKSPLTKLVETNVFGRSVRLIEGKCEYHGIVSATTATRWFHWQNSKSKNLIKRWGVAYNPVDCEFWGLSPKREHINAFRKDLGVTEDIPLIGFVITNWHPRILEMISILSKRIPEIKFVSIGMPDDLLKLVQRKKLSNYFINLPKNADDELIKTFWHTISVAVHASLLGETFGLSIGEAMASSKPVVTVSIPFRGNAQIELVENGKTGFVVYSPKAMASAIEYLLKNEKQRRRMGMEGAARAASLFNAHKVIRHWENIYLSLIQKNLNRKYYQDTMGDGVISGTSVKRQLNCYGRPNWISLLGGILANNRHVHRIGRFIKNKFNE